MSHEYFLYETGEQRLERLRKQRIDRIKEQLRKARLHVEKQEYLADVMSVPEKNVADIASGFSSGNVISDEVVSDRNIENGIKDSEIFNTGDEKKKRLDLSSYLDGGNGFQDEKERELAEIISGIDTRIPDSNKARSEYERFMKSVDDIAKDGSIDIDDRIGMINQRVTLYIENSNYDNSALDEDLLLDYMALCILLGEDEEIIPVEQLQDKVDSMLKEYTERSDKEVVADAVNDALSKLGMRVEGCCVLDGQIEGEVYSSENDSTCRVFISCDESGIMIEPVNVLDNADDEEVMNNQRKVCKAEKELIEEVSKNGVTLKKVYSKEHAPADIAGEKDIEFSEKVSDKKDNKFDKMRDYNRMRRNRRRREKERSRSIEL